MNRLSKAAWVSIAGTAAVLWSLSASADALHGFCYGTSTCSDNGTVTPTTSNPPSFGFTISSGPETGDFLVDILVPDNYTLPASYSITGTQGGALNNQSVSATASLVSTTAWTSGQLDSYLGFSASPTNPIGAFLPTTQADDSGATGYYVFQADLGTNRLQPNPDALSGPLLNIGTLDIGTVIVGFLETTVTCHGHDTPPCYSWNATANSGALYEAGAPTPPPGVPEPGTLLLFGAGLAGLGIAWRRKGQRR